MDTIPWINLAGIVAILGLGWRGYSRLDSKIDALGVRFDSLTERVGNIAERVARIEGILSVSEHHEAKTD